MVRFHSDIEYCNITGTNHINHNMLCPNERWHRTKWEIFYNQLHTTMIHIKNKLNINLATSMVRNERVEEIVRLLFQDKN